MIDDFFAVDVEPTLSGGTEAELELSRFLNRILRVGLDVELCGEGRVVAFRSIDELFLRGNREDGFSVFVLLWILREYVDVPAFCLVIWGSVTFDDWAESEG